VILIPYSCATRLPSVQRGLPCYLP
jgi:hypothetical protein